MAAPMQKKVVAFVFPMASGHINPSFPIARSLVRLGHSVHFLCREQMRGPIEDTGAVFHSDVEVETELYDGRTPDVFGAHGSLKKEVGLEATVHVFEEIIKLKHVQLELMLPGVLRWLTRLGAQVVVYDPLPLGGAQGALAAQVLGIPSIALLTLAGPGTLPRTMEEELLTVCRMTSEQVRDMALAFEPNIEATRRINAKYGVDLTYTEHAEPIGMLDVCGRSAVTLVTTSEDLQDPASPELAAEYEKLGARFVFVGPLLDEEGSKRAAGHTCKSAGTARGATDHTSREGSVDVVARVRAARAQGRGVVMVSMGTMITGDAPNIGWDSRLVGPDGRPRGLTGRELCHGAWGGAFDAFGAASAGEGPLLVVALGPQEAPLGDLVPPPNAVCLPSLAQVDLLKTGVDLFLTHGGQNSFTEGLANGVPLVVCPGFGDQPVNARKAVTLGVGLQVPRPVPTEGEEAAASAAYRADVAAALRRVYTEPGFGEAARACAARLAACGGVPRAVALTLEAAEARMKPQAEGMVKAPEEEDVTARFSVAGA